MTQAGTRATAFSGWLAQQVRSRGLSQTEAADLVGVTFRTFNRWIRGQSEPKLSQLRRICEAFGPPPIC
jgi:transcriptional regulator with XRE-family HTH domain